MSFVADQTAKKKYSPSHKKQIVALGHKLLYKLKELKQFYNKPSTSQQHNHIRTTNVTERENSLCRRSVGIVPI
jgi:transposase-like protein